VRASPVAATLISARSRAIDGGDGDVVDALHRHQLVEMRFEPPRAVVVGVDDDRHARDAGRLSVPDGERLDIERAAAEQRGDAVQDARLVVDVNRECMQHLQHLG
jgi:hypothetical protein